MQTQKVNVFNFRKINWFIFKLRKRKIIVKRSDTTTEVSSMTYTGKIQIRAFHVSLGAESGLVKSIVAIATYELGRR